MQTHVVPVPLKKHYMFMYENFLFSTQQHLYLLLDENEGIISALKFRSRLHKYGYPNDEALRAHPYYQYGLRSYGMFEVLNSPWIIEIRNSNRIHPRHSDDSYKDLRHFIVTFKDVTLDVISNEYEEIELTRDSITAIVIQQIDYLRNQNE